MDRGGDDEPRTELGRRARDELRAREEDRRRLREREERRRYVEEVHRPVLRLLRDPDPNLFLSQEELARLIEVAGDQGWEPPERREQAVGSGYEGTGDRHHRDHVQFYEEWPRDFTREQYDASIRRVIADRDTEVWGALYLDPRRPWVEPEPVVVFHGRTLDSEREGDHGREFIVVIYSLREARWKTAYQAADEIERYVSRPIWRGARAL